MHFPTEVFVLIPRWKRRLCREQQHGGSGDVVRAGAPGRAQSVETPSKHVAREGGPHCAELLPRGSSWSGCSLWVLRVSR